MDPTYNGNGLTSTGARSFWSCHKCGDPLLINGKSPPIATKVQQGEEPEAGPMAEQP